MKDRGENQGTCLGDELLWTRMPGGNTKAVEEN